MTQMRQNGRYFADIFKLIYVNENSGIKIQISLRFVPKSLISKTTALDQIIAWHRRGDEPLPEPIITVMS